MPGLRDEITKTIRRLSGRTQKEKPASLEQLEETVVATDLREGRHYGSYRVLRRLGSGGMGHVYLAMDMRLGRHAALKFLSPKLKSNPEMLARLQQEARTASSLNHPNILTIYDIDEAAGEPFIASEFVDGFTLRQSLERGMLNPEFALDIAIQTASALKAAHEAGVIHRDLKPGNIMVRSDCLVKVIDFGLAKLTPQGHAAPSYEPLSDPGSIAGTVQYMSPEQARGEEVDHRTDLWSLGVMLYEMVSHRKPFDGETESHIIVAILDHRPAELKVAAGTPTGLARIAERALAKNPDKRFQSAQEMLEALRALEAHSRSSGFGQSKQLAAAALGRLRKRRMLSIAALASLLVICLAIWWWQYDGREVLLGPPWFSPVAYTQLTHRGDVDMAVISPDGKRVAYSTTSNGQNQLHLLNVDTHKEFVWPPYVGNTLGLTFSSDSSTIFYTVHDQREWGRLYAAKENLPDPEFVLDDIDGPVSFSPDGVEFAFRRRFDDKRTNRESVVVAKTTDTADQRTVLTKYNQAIGFRIAWSATGVMAVDVPRHGLEGQSYPAVVLFSHNGQQQAEYTDPQLRLLSGPTWMNAGSMLIFSGYGRGSDDAQASIVELATHSGKFRFFPSPALTSNSLTASRDYQELAAVTSARKSTLWVAQAANPEQSEKWIADDSFDSLAWNSNNSVVYPTPRGGNVALWQAKRGGALLALPHGNDCVSRQPAAVPGKPLLVFSSNCDAAANASNLWTLNETDGTLAKLTEHSFSDDTPVVAPDGDTVLYNSWPNNYPVLMKVSLRTKVKSQFTPLYARNAAISPDGQHVACQVRENYDGQWRVAVLSTRDGAIEKDNLPLPAELNSVVRWSPDGKALDYVPVRDSANIWRFSLLGASAGPLTHLHGPPVDDFAWSPDGTQLAWVSSDVRQDIIIFHRGASRQ